MKGVMGKVLRVDLTEGTMREERIPEAVYEQLIGGVGLGAYYLYQHIPADADPLGPENILGFVSGLLTGTGSVMTGRWMAVCKSPLTGGWGDANCGGNLAPAIKQSGYDAVFFSGVSDKPVYFAVDSKGPRLEDAAHLWGMDTITAEQTIIAEYPGRKRPSVAVIGPAGENRSLISGISNDLGRFAARSGVGAVMGSKKLKAAAFAGIRKISCAFPDTVKELSKEYSAKIRRQNLPPIVKGGALPLLGKALGLPVGIPLDAMLTTGLFKKWGTIYNNAAGVVNGDSPLKNWSGSKVDYPAESYRKINPDNIIGRETRKYHCYSCVIGCGGICDISDLVPGTTHSHKPEYETVCVFGGDLLNDDLDAIFIINDMCNRGGIDTISAGSTAAFAIECFQNGLLTKKDTDGLELNWGDGKSVIELVRRMIAREGIGDLLADGTKQAALRLGNRNGNGNGNGDRAEKYAVHAGGQEPGLHDSRFDPLLGVHFAADPTPGRHTIGAGLYYTISHLWEKVSWAPRVTRPYAKSSDYLPSKTNALKTKANACYKALTDTVGGCMFAMITGVQHWKIFEYINAASGWDRTADDYMEAGLRVQTLRQLFNIKHGIDPRSFKLHPRMYGDPPLTEGPNKGKTVPIEEMVGEHWHMMGWDRRTGVPLEQTAVELGLDLLLAGAAGAAKAAGAADAGAAAGAGGEGEGGSKGDVDGK